MSTTFDEKVRQLEEDLSIYKTAKLFIEKLQRIEGNTGKMDLVGLDFGDIRYLLLDSYTDSFPLDLEPEEQESPEVQEILEKVWELVQVSKFK
jgi:hypothetical protein